MKIEKVEIKGFQSHSDSVFRLSPGLTVITGPSDSGKTALIRSIRWVAFGEPQGEAFMLTIKDPNTDIAVKQAEITEVKITLEDAVVITKTRRKGKTTYTHSSYPEPWEKAEVPKEIKEALGLTKNSYGDNFETALNFAFQLEAPFIISETASIGAKVLGVIAGTEVIDKAISSISKSTFKLREDKRAADKQIGELNVELLEYLEVDDLKARVENCENFISGTEVNFNRLHILSEKIQHYSLAIDTITSLNQELDKLSNVPCLMNDLMGVDSCSLKLQVLKGYSDEHNNLQCKLDSLYEVIDKIGNIEEAGDLLNRANIAQVKLNEGSQLVGSLTRLNESIVAANEELSNYIHLKFTEEQLLKLEQVTGKYNSYKSLNINYKFNDENSNTAVEKLKKFAHIQKAIDEIGKSEKENYKLCALSDLRSSYSATSMEASRIESYTQQFMYLDKTSPIFGIVNSNVNNVDKFKEVELAFRNAETEFENRTRYQEGAIRELIEAGTEVDRAWESAGGKCPLCESSVISHKH